MTWIAVILAALLETSSWCADRFIGENERGRYAIDYLWEGEPAAGGGIVCRPLPECATTDSSGDGITGMVEFEMLVSCWGTSVDDHIPPPPPPPPSSP